MSLMSFWSSPGGAATITAGASVLDGAFGGGDSYGRQKRLMRKQYEYQHRYGPGITQAQTAAGIQGAVQGAKAAGLHPLFAMGNSASVGSEMVSLPAGQSERGSRFSDAAQAALSAYQGTQVYQAQKDLIDSQAELARARALEQVTSNDNAREIVSRAPHGPDFNPAKQEYEKGKYTAHDSKHREKSMNVISPMSKFRIGSQSVWLPIEEMDQLTEDPAAVIALAATYHGNKQVDWPLLLQEYRHGTSMTPRQATVATQKAFKRTAKQRRERARRPFTSDQFYPYSRGPHR